MFQTDSHRDHCRDATFKHLKIDTTDKKKALQALQKVPAKELLDACDALMMVRKLRLMQPNFPSHTLVI